MDRSLASRAPVAPRGRRGSTFADLLSWLRGAGRRWLFLRERDAIRRSLGSLSDATLRDLGLTRGEFGSVAVGATLAPRGVPPRGANVAELPVRPAPAQP